jgi:serine/threonine protein kinase/tetratricopeptide (TPR) repeat protein
MRKHFTCAQGHQWQAELEGGFAVAGISCPTCGAPAETMNGPRPALAATQTQATEMEGSRVGPYKLLQKIGEGGMGTVYMAEQEHPVRRRVALKIIKPGMDSTHVIARFEAERQALALMDHPNIAKVLDAGTIADCRLQDADFKSAISVLQPAITAGRPYFVMELVKGTPITKYCDDARLPLRKRLELFIQVCQALQHAHQKGIIHRDIKPTNVLVAPFDGQPVVKVIDFGVAKAIGHQLTDRTLFTELGVVVGTLQYMSPEQAELNNLDIDTRSDIYSLGVLLYELLTGTTPLEEKRLRAEVMAMLLVAIHKEEPPKPSTRLRQSKDTLPSIAAQRQIEPERLTKLVRGELDWIVMKALAKDRNRRYETANGLVRDLQRYLADEPVEACPPSSVYKLRKLARKHRSALVTATAFAALLVVGLVISIWQAIRATRAETVALTALEDKERARAAEAEQREKAVANEKSAKEREAEARAVLDFLENRIFAAARPEGQEGGLGHDVTLRRALEAALPFVESSFHDQPLIAARLRMTVAWSFISLGEWKIAVAQYEKARAIYLQQLGADAPETLRSTRDLAAGYNFLQRYGDAHPLLDEALQKMKATLGPDHPDTLSALIALATTYAGLGQVAEALRLREETLALQKAKLGPDDPGTLVSMINLGTSYAASGRHEEALKLNQETLKRLTATHGPHHPPTLLTMANMAGNYAELGRYQDALKLYEATLPLQRVKMGVGSPYTLATMRRLAAVYQVVGRHAEALRLGEEALQQLKEKLGSNHPDTLITMHNLASSYGAVGRGQDALRLNEETAVLMRSRLGPDHDLTFKSLNNLANCYIAFGRSADGLRVREELLATRQAKLGPDHFDTLRSMYLVGCSHLEMKNHAAAEAILLDRQARVEQNAASLPPEVQYVAIPQLIQLYDAWGKPEVAEKWRAKLPPVARVQDGLERHNAWPLLWGWPRF